jgi:hypothetical protein
MYIRILSLYDSLDFSTDRFDDIANELFDLLNGNHGSLFLSTLANICVFFESIHHTVKLKNLALVALATCFQYPEASKEELRARLDNLARCFSSELNQQSDNIYDDRFDKFIEINDFTDTNNTFFNNLFAGTVEAMKCIKKTCNLHQCPLQYYRGGHQHYDIQLRHGDNGSYKLFNYGACSCDICGSVIHSNCWACSECEYDLCYECYRTNLDRQ